MRFLDVGQEARGVIAIGQIATGVVAVGQVATGVVAVGQGARGIFVLGQGAIGVVAVGMGAVGLLYTVAMMGAGGRGVGGVIPLTPSLGPSYRLPRLGLEAGGGWVKGRLVPGEGGRARLEVPGVPARLAACLRGAADAATTEGAREVLAELRPDGEGMTAVDLRAVPRSRLGRPGWWLIWTLQSLGLLALSALVWVVCVFPLLPLFGLRLKLPPWLIS